MMRNTNQFASNFSYYGCMGSIIAIAMIAVCCQLIDHRHDYHHHDNYRGFDDVSLVRTDIIIDHPNYKPNAKSHNNNRRRMQRELNDDVEDGSSNLPCGDIFMHVNKNNVVNANNYSRTTSIDDDDINNNNYEIRLCHYAQTCDGDYPSQTFLPLILCHGIHNNDKNNNTDDATITNIQYYYILQTIFIYAILPPLLLLYLLLLFRLLATTADSYFSPALESFSFELGLPPRFAGATLLALGNGSPDLGSTVNAILLWDENSSISIGDDNINRSKNNIKNSGGSWTMSLGSLAGGGMFVGTIVCGLLIQKCNGIPCRIAFLRDVSMYAISVYIVWHTFESGSVTRGNVQLFLGIYLGYIVIILLSDVYHRRVTLKRLHEEGKVRRRSLNERAKKRLSKLTSVQQQKEELNGIVATTDVSEVNERSVSESTPLMHNLHDTYTVDYGAERIEQLKACGGQIVTINDEVDYVDSEMAEEEEEDYDDNNNDLLPPLPSFDSSTSSSGTNIPRRPTLSMPDRFAMLMSNYDPRSVKFSDVSSRASSTLSSADDDTTELEKITTLMRRHVHPGIHSSFRVPPSVSEEEEGIEGQQQIQEQQEEVCSQIIQPSVELLLEDEPELELQSTKGLLIDAYDELIFRGRNFLKNYFESEVSPMEKICLILELPFVAVRTVSSFILLFPIAFGFVKLAMLTYVFSMT